MLARLRPDEIGGGVVRRAFRSGTTYLRRGKPLTGDEVRRFTPSSRNALIDNGFLAVWPKGSDQVEAAPPAERFMVHKGRQMYDVIEGRRLSDKPLPKDQAEALVIKGAARPN